MENRLATKAFSEFMLGTKLLKTNSDKWKLFGPFTVGNFTFRQFNV